jgi:hypothetical protein
MVVSLHRVAKVAKRRIRRHHERAVAHPADARSACVPESLVEVVDVERRMPYGRSEQPEIQ